MIVDLDPDAVELGRIAQRALADAGGDLLVQRAEADPSARRAVEPVLGALGVWELDPAGPSAELEAAASVCRAAGYWAAPYPVAERLARPAGLAVDVLSVVAGPRPAASAAARAHLRWGAVGLDGVRFLAHALPADEPVRHTAFVTPLALTPLDNAGAAGLPLAVLLPVWTLLGSLDRAVEVTRAQVQVRVQFGQPLATFQGVQFQLTEAEVERAGLEALAKYTLWSVGRGGPEALADALALRLAGLEAAETVFRVAHQLHGATGFCDETQLSWLSRYSQPLRRLPLGLSATRAALTALVGRRGLPDSFDPEPVAAVQ